MPDASRTDAALGPFETSLRGELLRPESDGYDEARALWNAMIDERPALIARCTGVADVIAAVKFARETGLTVAVRGGGHNVAGLASVDGGLMIDLSLMRAVDVDPESRTVRVQGGAQWGDVDHETQAFGLATPSGIISTTGVAGLTLGGGFGWLARTFGLAADNLLAADVVTAEGELVKASAQENADLFWAIRGGGGNFGVVTSFEFRLHELGPEVLFGPTVHRLEDAAAVLRHYEAFTSRAPKECTVYADFLTAPPLPFLPEQVHGTKVLFLIQCYVGDLEDGEEILRPLREFGRPLADAVAPARYAEAQRRSDPLYPKGGRYYWKSHNLATLSDELIDTLVGCAATMPNPLCDILIQHLGGRIGEPAPDATAYPHRDAGFIVTLGGRAERPAEDEQCIGWARECHTRLSEHAATGVYVNFLSHDESEERLRAAFGDNAERLRRIKTRYDPHNFFRRNHNIEPQP
ncbi:FAD-binding oxidoreductase [Ectothiorhodospiraceae bacterium 2226]|nr:FAD-binding oxidoreductase [Ectothiorhodospiraceae bacterium 2226]